MGFSPGGSTEDREDDTALWALMRGWPLHTSAEHLCRALYGLLAHENYPKIRESERSALRVRCEQW